MVTISADERERVGREPARPAGAHIGRVSADLHTDSFCNMDRLEKLKELEKYLYQALQIADSKSLASIARQYRETLKDIEALEGGIDDTDEIQKILSSRPDWQSDTDSEDNA